MVHAAVPHRVDDDFYILYAATYRKMDVEIVSNDIMRDHGAKV
jgi:hypothetical protein